MGWEDWSYLGTVTLAGGLARALRRGLPEGWRLRLEARPPEDLPSGWLWLHAVSVGELLLAEGVLGWLRAQGYAVHVTTGTPAGLELLARRLPLWNQAGPRVTGGGFPLDDPTGLRPFLETPPGAFIALETELWPNLMRALAARGIPRMIVNGRLTGRSLDRGGHWVPLAASRLTAVAARDEASAEAFRRLGAPRVALGGNLKADLPPPNPLHVGWDPLRQAWGKVRVLVAGNTVVVKPSSDTPVMAARLFAMAEEAGFPPGVMNLTPGAGGELGDHLVTHAATRFVAFTGSAAVGLRMNALIARVEPPRRWLTRLVAELGGKNAILVDETADLDAASSGILRSAFGFQGQKCSACSRLVVDHRVKDRLLEQLIAKAKRLPVADPWEDPCVFTGPVANQGACRDILKAIETSRGEARLLLGGHRLDRDGYFIEPTIFDGVPVDGFLGQEEVFGPVLGVIAVASFEQALAVGNATRYGLTGAVYSQAPERLAQARSDFHVGNLYLNRGCTGAMVGVHPFGGFNLSGTDSKAGGPDYLLNFTQGQTVSERVTVLRVPGIGA